MESFVELACEERNGPTLTWPGKRLSVRVAVPPGRVIETFTAGARSTAPRAGECAENLDGRGLLLHGENREALAWLLASGYARRVNLIYIDPPYNSGNEYTSRVRLRGKGGARLGNDVQYRDVWESESAYLQFMAERMLLLKELLHPNGTLWLHCDHRMQAHLLLLLQEIFGVDCHLNTITWRSQTARGAKVHARYFPHSVQTLHVFARHPNARPVWNPPRREIVMTRAEAAARFMQDERGFFRTSDPGTYSFEKLVALHAEDRLYAPYRGKIVVDAEKRRVYASNGGNIGVKYYVEPRGRDHFVVTRAVDNLWDDIPGLGTVPGEDVNYPTQKPEGLLRRILETATLPGDTVLDAFVGSGTTVAVAQKLGRRWMGCDDNWRALRTTAGRVARAAQEMAQSTGYWILGMGDQGLETGNRRSARSGGEASATIDVQVVEGTMRVTVRDFHSPAVAALAAQTGVPLPDDWRAQVQAVLIDPDSHGAVFRAAVVDAPAGKEATVAGIYNLKACPGTGSVAVQLVDVLGRETMVRPWITPGVAGARPEESTSR